MTITTGAGVAVVDTASVACNLTVGVIEAVASGSAVSSDVACKVGSAPGILLPVIIGSAVSLGKSLDRTCAWEGVPICSGCPQPANTSTISSIFQ